MAVNDEIDGRSIYIELWGRLRSRNGRMHTDDDNMNRKMDV